MATSTIVKTRYAQKVRAQQFAKRYIENNFNGAKTVRELYKKPEHGSLARTMAAEIVANPSVKLAVAEQLDAVGLTDEKLDGELLRVVKQNKQLSPKLGAIIEANKMKQRYPKDSITQAHLHLHGVDQGNIDSKIDEILGEIKQLGS